MTKNMIQWNVYWVYLKESFCEFILGLLAVIVVKSPGTQIETE